MTLARRHLPGLLSVLSGLLLWEIVGRSADLLFLPPVSQILVALWTFLADGTLFDSLLVSLVTLAGGMAISIVLGITTGALMARYAAVRDALDIYLNAAMAAPMIAFVPVLILLFGLGYPTRVLAVVLFAIFPIIVNTYAGIRNVDPVIVEMARSFGGRERQLFWKVRFPAALPLLRAGLRLGTSRGVKGLINGEVIIAVVGLGALVNQYGTAFTMDRLYAIILFLLVIAVVTVNLVDRVTRRLLRGEV